MAAVSFLFPLQYHFHVFVRRKSRAASHFSHAWQDQRFCRVYDRQFLVKTFMLKDETEI